MLDLKVILEPECWDSDNDEFIPEVSKHIKLEHSLLSISRWESEYKKSFLSSKDLDSDKLKYYIRCMLIDESDEQYLDNMSDSNYNEVIEYIKTSRTATVVNYHGKSKPKNDGKIITSEQLYCQMFSNGIPIDCERWHISRLIALLEVFNASSNPEKMSKKETAQYYAQLNKARRAKKK